MTFDEFFQSVCAALQKADRVTDVSRQFAAVATDAARISLALEIPELSGPLQHLVQAFEEKKKAIGSKKIAKASVAFRLQGNDAYQRGQNDQALELYTRSILHAPHPSPSEEKQQEEERVASPTASSDSLELSLAYANRSAVLFQLGQYSHALRDINAAIFHGYPPRNRYKLYERRAKCHLKAGDMDALNLAVLNFRRAEASLSESDLSQEKRSQYGKNLDQQLQDLQMCTISRNVPVPTEQDLEVETYSKPKIMEDFKKWEEPNNHIPCASSAIEIAFTKERGRHVVATRDLEPGEKIICESPYASILLPEYSSSHCSNCHQRCPVPLPCFFSNTVRFCSVTCRMESLPAVSLKNDIWPFLNASELGKNALLAFQIVVQTGLEYFLKFATALSHSSSATFNEEEERSKGFNEDGIYDSSDYRTMYHLIANTESRSVADLFKRALMAVYLLKILELGNFFGSVDRSRSEWSTSTSKLVTVGSFFLLHLQNLPCNAHDVSELIVPKNSLSESYIKDIGCGAYATLSLINHSCDPNVIRHYVGRQAVVSVIGHIREGSEILDNYGYHYAVHPYVERQLKLRQQYYFQCSCPACQYKWPEYLDIPTQILFQCYPDCASVAVSPLPPTVKISTNTSELCVKCGRVALSLSKFRNSSHEFQLALQKLLQWTPMKDTGETLASEQLKPVFCQHMSLLDRYVVKPFKECNDAQEALKQVLAMEATFSLVM